MPIYVQQFKRTGANMVAEATIVMAEAGSAFCLIFKSHKDIRHHEYLQ